MKLPMYKFKTDQQECLWKSIDKKISGIKISPTKILRTSEVSETLSPPEKKVTMANKS